jgi:hypothetical protein
MNNLTPMCAADYLNWHEGMIVTPAFGAPSESDYASVTDHCAISFIDAIGTSTRYMLPAPQAGIFTVDDWTMDLLNPAVFAVGIQAGGSLAIEQTALPVLSLVAGWLFHKATDLRQGFNVSNANPTLRDGVMWADSFGRTLITTYVGVSNLAAFLTALAGISNAILMQTWEGVLQINPAFSPTSSIYASVNDLVRFIFADAKGNKTNVLLPAPFATIFMQDRKTVDKSNVDVGLFVTAALSELIVPSSGLPVTRFIGGYLSRQKV